MAPIRYPNSRVQAIDSIRAMLVQAPIDRIIDETERDNLMEVNTFICLFIMLMFICLMFIYY
jgi:trans-aconitate methyltransferase